MVHPVDASVGAQVRQFRRQRGMTQTELGDILGLTFQQIQKYERGTNRISASKLAMLAEALNVHVGAFFEDCENGQHDNKSSDVAEDVRALVASFDAMPDKLQKDFLRMVQSIATASY